MTLITKQVKDGRYMLMGNEAICPGCGVCESICPVGANEKREVV